MQRTARIGEALAWIASVRTRLPSSRNTIQSVAIRTRVSVRKPINATR